MSADERILRTLRAQAWERAKGELQAMLHTFWGGTDEFRALATVVDAFIREIEDNALAE